MTFSEAINKYDYIKRKGWIGQFIYWTTDRNDNGLFMIGQYPGLNMHPALEDFKADDYEEFIFPEVDINIVI